MPEQLTSQQISFYEENGYLVIENQIPKSWLAKIHAEISRFEEEAAELEHSNDRLDLEDSIPAPRHVYAGLSCRI